MNIGTISSPNKGLPHGNPLMLMTLFVVLVMYDVFHRNKDVTKENLDAPEAETA